VFFDLMTIRFLLKYMSRPMHFFGSLGASSMLGGLALSMWLLVLKVLTHQHIMDQHGPLFVVAGVLILAGIQLLAIGLIGELLVRHFYQGQGRAPYTIDRVIRLNASGEASILRGE